ncbi:transcriptional regulator [Actinorhabdospora filicis]|uniref:Transcriptional regulator n=1 Tax=Actinorhabdospora filicis TaxID=1785913 RepID=A0A9W6STD9_9ACTN|nr:helix-turn-helix transcriptional regulator [Actinorhabdospora filicis]GLZ81615.1 transcriptional regulator [Actinorhabdospora filicis]
MTSAPSSSGGATGPTALRMLLGAHLRRLREAEGISRADAGWEIRSSESKISRMELGRVSFKERDIDDLLTLYGVDDPDERKRLLDLAREANAPGWWHRFGDVLPGWFQSYMGLEATASLIRNFEVQFVPGLLQTRAYAEAVVRLAHDLKGSKDVERRVDLRMSRQAVLTRPNAPRLWTVIDEAALRRPIGGREIMRDQLETLIKLSGKANVQIQIIKSDAGGHAGAGGAFTVLRFPDADLPDLIYLEQLTSALYLDKRDDVDQYVAAMERLCVQASPPSDTPKIIDAIIDELY